MIKIDDTTGCWEWQGLRDKDGYGVVSIGGKPQRVHRVMYGLWREAVPAGLLTDHVVCRNHACCNPEHLRVVTAKVNTVENSQSVQAKNAAKTHCIRGHEFTPENTLVNKKGGRVCRTCKALHAVRLHRIKQGETIPLEEMSTMQPKRKFKRATDVYQLS